jgi:hypothetical protein
MAWGSLHPNSIPAKLFCNACFAASLNTSAVGQNCVINLIVQKIFATLQQNHFDTYFFMFHFHHVDWILYNIPVGVRNTLIFIANGFNEFDF